MRLIRLLLLALAPALAGCVTVDDNAGGEPLYYVMRHLNTPEGQRDPDLLPEGTAAAQRVPELMTRQRPAAIYVSTFKRTEQTAAAVAARWGLTPIVYNPADTPGLVARARTAPGPVLIVGHSNTVPDIVEQLGGARPAPLNHPDFGDLWIIAPDGATQRVRVEQ